MIKYGSTKQSEKTKKKLQEQVRIQTLPLCLTSTNKNSSAIMQQLLHSKCVTIEISPVSVKCLRETVVYVLLFVWPLLVCIYLTASIILGGIAKLASQAIWDQWQGEKQTCDLLTSFAYILLWPKPVVPGLNQFYHVLDCSKQVLPLTSGRWRQDWIGCTNIYNTSMYILPSLRLIR